MAASELQSVVPIAFEVRTRLPKFYILIYGPIGLSVSILLTVVLQKRLVLREAQLSGAALLDDVRTDLARHPDPVSKKAIAENSSALNTALSGTDSAAILKGRADLEKVWQKALAGLATRRQDAQTTVDALRGVVETRRQIPPDAEQVLAVLRERVARVRELIAKDDIATAVEGQAARRASPSPTLPRRWAAGRIRWAGS